MRVDSSMSEIQGDEVDGESLGEGVVVTDSALLVRNFLLVSGSKPEVENMFCTAQLSNPISVSITSISARSFSTKFSRSVASWCRFDLRFSFPYSVCTVGGSLSPGLLPMPTPERGSLFFEECKKPRCAANIWSNRSVKTFYSSRVIACRRTVGRPIGPTEDVGTGFRTGSGATSLKLTSSIKLSQTLRACSLS